MGRKKKIIGVVSLYRPSEYTFQNITTYIRYFDYCIMMDDSEKNNENLYFECFSGIYELSQYQWNGKNIGLCRSLNEGIRLAVGCGADWIVIMDSDSSFKTDIVKVFRNYIEVHNTKKTAILAPQHNYGRHKRKPKNLEKKIILTQLSGCAFNVEIINKIGCFDEKFFIDGLDYEWELRAVQKGYDIIRCGAAVLDHNPGHEKELKIFGKSFLRYGWDTDERYYYQYKALMLIWKKYGYYKILLIFLYKIIKPLLLFKNGKAYLLALKKAMFDMRKGYFGRWNNNYDDYEEIHN